MNLYAAPTTIDPADCERIGANLYAIRSEWKPLPPVEKHRAVIAYYAGAMKGDAVFSNISGAVMRDLPLPRQIPYRPHCYSTARRKSAGSLIQWHLSAAALDFDRVGVARVAKSERVLVDLATSIDAAATLTALNHCLAHDHFSVSALEGYLRRNTGVHGSKRLRSLLPFANGGCESPLETIAWLAIYSAGLTMPELQVKIADAGGFAGRVDMHWQTGRRSLIVELDGKVKYTDREVLFKEKKREDRITEAGHRVLRFTWQDIQSGRLVSRLKDIGIPERRNFGRKFPHWDTARAIGAQTSKFAEKALLF
ncbi:MAG: endonuclease domain-containing protein [Clostridiales Family XIII bacterium]|nr:endonuclease domain-containing protein [Clostridiales Family XIII bacterium]